MIRIVSGRFRGRRIATPPGDGTRPAANAHREAVLNSLQMHLHDARVLDAFAGSGALGIESLSRGAAHVTFLERSHRALMTVRRNLAELGVTADEHRALGVDTYAWDPGDARFDVAFVAPPYPHFRERPDDVARLLARLRLHVAPDARVVVQSETGDFAPPAADWEVVRDRAYGRTAFTFLAPA